jgi:hypothetical protein
LNALFSTFESSNWTNGTKVLILYYLSWMVAPHQTVEMRFFAEVHWIVPSKLLLLPFAMREKGLGDEG